MYVLLKDGEVSYQSELKMPVEDGTEYFCVANYDDLEEICIEHQLLHPVLQAARHFGYVKYDCYEEHDCISMEMLDFENIMILQGSVVVHLEANRAFFFSAQYDRVLELLMQCVEMMGERPSIKRLLFFFFEIQTRDDEIVFDAMEKEILDLEQALLSSEKHNCVAEIISLRKRLMILKKYYDQLMDALDILEENENGFFDGKTLRSFKTLSRRTQRRFDSVLDLKESVTQVRESYEAEVDISLNMTMKIFTVVTTIFFPLTVIVGWYGMNFDMPEYHWSHGYLFLILLSISALVVGVVFFHKKKWF